MEKANNRVSDIPLEFTAEYYDRKYFADPIGKSHKRADGTLEYWGYKNLTGESLGSEQIVEAWKKMFQPKTMLDFGCGRGTLVAYARKAGIEAVGFDFSEWAVNEGRYARCKREWLKVHDATKPFPYPDKSFDLVVGLDIMEHIYLPDLPALISEIRRVAKKWVFLQIAVAADGMVTGKVDQEQILERGKPVPIELEGMAAAGHVTVVHPDKWEEWLSHDDWVIRRDMVNWFVSLVDRNIIHNWLLNYMVCLELL